MSRARRPFPRLPQAGSPRDIVRKRLLDQSRQAGSHAFQPVGDVHPVGGRYDMPSGGSAAIWPRSPEPATPFPAANAPPAGAGSTIAISSARPRPARAQYAACRSCRRRYREPDRRSVIAAFSSGSVDQPVQPAQRQLVALGAEAGDDAVGAQRQIGVVAEASRACDVRDVHLDHRRVEGLQRVEDRHRGMREGAGVDDDARRRPARLVDPVDELVLAVALAEASSNPSFAVSGAARSTSARVSWP